MSEARRNRNNLALPAAIAGVLAASSAHAIVIEPVPIPNYDVVAFCQSRANRGSLSEAACVQDQYALQRSIAEVWDGLSHVAQSECTGIANRHNDYDVLFQCIDSYSQNDE
jgi:hypothetical protein